MIDYNMKIVGCTGRIDQVADIISKVNLYGEKQGIEIQLFDAHMIFGKPHLISAFEHAKRSIQRGENVTHSLGMEILLYASGERQIKKAIKKMGIKKGGNLLVILFLHPSELNKKIDTIVNEFLKDFNLEKNDSVILPDKTMLSEYGISKQAISSVSKNQVFQLVLEKIALVDVIKK